MQHGLQQRTVEGSARFYAVHSCALSHLNAHQHIKVSRHTHTFINEHRKKHSVISTAGKCWFVGSGPGPLDFLTVKAVRLLQMADVIVYDDLAQEALVHAKESCRKIYVGKRGGRKSFKQSDINEILVQECETNDVIRLKGGCPSVFSRVGSEMQAVKKAGFSFELVPGISSALAAPLFAGFPLTLPPLSNSFAVVSGHDVSLEWSAYSRIPTLVILMGSKNLQQIVNVLQLCGWSKDAQVCIIKNAGYAEQQSWKSTLSNIVATVSNIDLSPAIIVVGAIVDTDAWL